MTIRKIGLQFKAAFVYGKNALGEERLITTGTVDINASEAEVLESLKSSGYRFVVGSEAYKDVYVTFEDRYK